MRECVITLILAFTASEEEASEIIREKREFSNINSILAVIYLTKLQNLINLPVMNCSMSSFPYFYFSNYILFDFPSSGLIFL